MPDSTIQVFYVSGHMNKPQQESQTLLHTSETKAYPKLQLHISDCTSLHLVLMLR